MKRRLIITGFVVVLLLVVVFDTKYLTAEEVRELNPPPFNAETFSKKEFPKVAKRIAADATDVATVAPAVEKDLPAAGRRYGQDLGSGNYSFPLKASGTASKVDAAFVLLEVPGVPKGTEVRIPLKTALNGTPVRDATGTITYGRFKDQTDFQSVANQFKLRMQQDVVAKLDVKALEGKKVTVSGGWNTGGPPRSFIIQPTTVEVAP